MTLSMATKEELVQEYQSTNQNISSKISFVIDRSAFLKTLGHVQSVVEKRNTLPILSNVKIEAKEGLVSFTATDMDIAIIESVPANISEEGALTVPAHTLYDIIRKLPDGSEVSVSGDAGHTGRVKISAGSCNFSLASLPVTDFPVMDRGDMANQFMLSPAELTALIEKTKFAISTEETRYYLNGVYFHLAEDNGVKLLRGVATDGHRLARVEVAAPEGSENMPGVIIPRKTVAELKKLLDEVEDAVFISVSDTKICFETGKAILLSKLIDGNFPDYERVIPSGNDKQLEISTSALTKGVDRVATIASDRTRAIKFSLQPGKLVLSASSDDNGTGVEEIEASYDSSQVDIGFNSRYVLEMLSGLEGATVQIIFRDSNSPALVKDTGDSSSLYVIMPMRI